MKKTKAKRSDKARKEMFKHMREEGTLWPINPKTGKRSKPKKKSK